MNRIAILTALLIAMCIPDCRACTSAIIGSHRSASGKTLLWKHRDTSSTQNFMARSRGEKFNFVALFNADDSLMREAWTGINEAGFAIMNTQSYNLAPDTASIADREGFLMVTALGKCSNLTDFQTLLDTLPRPMGVQANFGVMDADGNAAWFETHDHGYRRFDISSDSIAIRTNFSCSGECGAGLGHERYEAAEFLLANRESISPAYLTDTVSCSFYPDLGRTTYTDKGQYIPRWSTSASVVIEQGGKLFVKPGYPPVSEHTYDLTIDSIPPALLPNPIRDWTSPAWIEAEKRRNAIYHRNKRGERIVTFPKPQ